MQEKNEPILQAENSIPIEQLETKLEMIITSRQCCSFLDDWYRDITGASQDPAKMRLS